MSSTATSSYWTSVNGAIDVYLKQSIPMKPPFIVFEPMHQLTSSAPPNTAPALCIAACELVGGLRDQAMAAASALRLVHAAASAHEQIVPRGMSDHHHVFGPNIRLLTGDGLIPFGFELLAQKNNLIQNPERIVRVIVEITRSIGAQGMIYGEWNKLSSESEKLSEWIEKVCKKKEGEFHACAGACGAILGGGNEDEIERLRRFGLYVGILQGIFKWGGQSEETWLMNKVNELRNLSLQELQHFDHKGRVEAVSELLYKADV